VIAFAPSVQPDLLERRPIYPWKPTSAALLDDADFMRRLGIAEAIKAAMRRSYARSRIPNEAFDKMLSRARSFWPEYEEINRVWVPEDPVFSGPRSGVTLATTTDLWTYTSPAAGQARILEHFIGGESTASTVLRLAVQRSTGGATATNQTLEKMSTRSPASVGTFATTWTTQPTLSGNPLLFHAFNTFGGTDRWVPQPGEEIYQVNGELLSARSQSGVPVVSSHLVLEEL
jgi:hypothetical protein